MAASLLFDVDYNGALLSPGETAPVLMTWSSLPAVDGGTRQSHYFPVLWSDEHKQDAHTIAAHVTFAMRDGRVVIPRDTTFGVRIKAHMENEHKQASLQNCGDKLIPLGYLIEQQLDALETLDFVAASDALHARQVPAVLRFDVLEDSSGTRVAKGAAVISCIRAIAGDASEMSAEQIAEAESLPIELETDDAGQLVPLDEFSYTPANEKFLGTLTQLPMMRGIFMFTEQALAGGYGVSPTTKESMRIHSPYFVTVAGKKTGSSYAMRAGRAAPLRFDPLFDRVEAWHTRVFDIVLWRANRSAPWFIETVTAQMNAGNRYDDVNMPLACEILAQATCVAPTSMPYVPDTVSTKSRGFLRNVRTKRGYVTFKLAADGSGVHGVERFSDMPKNDGGDCEDGGKYSYETALAISEGEWKSPLLAAAKMLADQYVPTMNLTSVRDASVSNDLSKSHQMLGEDVIDSPTDRKQKFGAHIFHMLIPAAKYVAMVRRAVPDVNVDMLWPKNASRQPWAAALRVKIAEATGRIVAEQEEQVATIIFDDANDTRRKALVARLDARAKLMKHLLSDTRTLVRMSMVREQPRTTQKPNVRLTKFYRNIVHVFTRQPMSRGLTNVDFLFAQCGEREPVAFDGDFNRSPLSEKLLPLDTAAAPLAASAVDSSLAPDVEVPLEMLGAASRVASHSSDLVASRAKPVIGALRYGAPLYDVLQSPLPAKLALAPSTPLTAREMRAIAVMMRHSPPVAMVGDPRDLDRMHTARLESLRANCGIDISANEAAEDAIFQQLQKQLRVAMGTLRSNGRAKNEWPSKQSRSTELVTFLFETHKLVGEGVVDAVVADVAAMHKAGVVRFVRTRIEEPLQHRRVVALQLLCDPSKV